jgi:hypothetical protein
MEGVAMRLLRQVSMSITAGLVMVSCTTRVEDPAPSALHEVHGTRQDFQYAGFVVRDGDVPQVKMLRSLVAELWAAKGTSAQDLREVDELIVLCEEAEQDPTVRAGALKKWNVVRPKVDLALMNAHLQAYDDPANDADAQGKQLNCGTGR